MSARTHARWLAPLALVATLVAVFLIVTGSGTSSNDSAGGPPARTATSTTKKATKPKKAVPKTYTVQSGDTLSAIASKTGVSAAQITELNPNLDPQGLQVGQKVKLRP